MADALDKKRSLLLSRRSLLTLCLFTLCYPLYRFIQFAIPRKPVQVKITDPIPASGNLVTTNFILFDDGESSWAVSRKCTHLGCKVSYQETENRIECPCHQSRFTPHGTLLRGPAKKNLPTFKVVKNDTSPYYIVTL